MKRNIIKKVRVPHERRSSAYIVTYTPYFEKNVKKEMHSMNSNFDIEKKFGPSKVFFPKQGAEELIQQLVYFGVEKHDDLVDAFTIVLHMVIEKDRPKVRFLTREQAAIIRYGYDYNNRGGRYWF